MIFTKINVESEILRQFKSFIVKNIDFKPQWIQKH